MDRPIQDRLLQLPLHLLVRRLRWAVPALVVALAAVHQIVVRSALHDISPGWQRWVELAFYGLTGSVAAWIGLTWIAAQASHRAEAEARLRRAFEELEQNHNRLLTLHDFGRKVTHAGDEQSLFELAARAPVQLTGAKGSTVVTFDAKRDKLQLDMAWGLSESYVGALKSQIDGGIPSHRCHDCTKLKTEATSDCPLFQGLHEAAAAEGIRSLLCVPVVHEEERVGVISAYFPSADGPPEDQTRLLIILGGAITAVLESLRLRTRQANTLPHLGRLGQQRPRNASTDAIGELTSQVLNIAASGWESDAGGIFLYEEDQKTWTCRARRGLGDSMADPRFSLGLELARRAHATGSPVLVPDLEGGNGSSLETGHGLRSATAAPLIADGLTLGALFLGAHQRRRFNPRHTELLAAMAYQIALAIRNAQLYAQLGQMAVVEERFRLSREIHDGLAQTLSYLSLQSERLATLIEAEKKPQALRELAEMRRAIRGGYVDAREAIDGLRLSVADSDPLSASMAEYIRDFSRQFGIPVDFVTEPEVVTTDPSTAQQILRIAQEALTNVRKHAEATRVNVELRDLKTEIQLVITDDGQGFPESRQPGGFRSHGLASMRERAESVGGTLTVATGPGQGTRITGSIRTGPLP